MMPDKNGIRLNKMKEVALRFRSPEYFVQKFYEKFSSENEKAIEILEQGLRIHPHDLRLNYIKAKLYFNADKSEKAVQNWRTLIKDSPKFHLYNEDYKIAYHIFQKHGTILDCMITLEKNVLHFPDDKERLFEYVNSCIICHEAEYKLVNCIDIIKQIIPYCTDKNTSYLLLSILFNLINDNAQSKDAISNIPGTDKETLESVKVELFNKEDSKIEYYKKPSNTASVVVTFDHMYMNWTQPPFGFPFLEKQDVDVIAIRKRKKHTFQQDLSLEVFEKSVKPLLSNYKNIVFYGHSLGAYLALYYGAVFNNINILATAPRLSIHPDYGSKKLANKGFQHHTRMNVNEQVKPVIVYDPKNKRDKKYIENEIINSYPNSHLVQVPYGGHGMVNHLHRMGKLKEFVTMTMSNKTPYYEKEYRRLSSDYYRELANKCLKHNKLMWSDDLINEALDRSPEDYRCIKLAVEIYMKTENWNKALVLLEENNEKLEKKPDLMLYLFDVYVAIDRIESARRVLKEIKLKYNKKKPVKKREKIIENLLD